MAPLFRRQHYRVTGPDYAGGAGAGEHANVSLMVERGGAQYRGVVAQFVLRMRGHRAADRRPHVTDPYRAADFKRATEPSIFNEAAGVGAGVDQDVGAEAARIEVR